MPFIKTDMLPKTGGAEPPVLPFFRQLKREPVRTERQNHEKTGFIKEYLQFFHILFFFVLYDTIDVTRKVEGMRCLDM